MNKHKKLFAVFTLVCFMFTLLPISAFAETEPVTSGKCGENATWIFENGVLTVTGSGYAYEAWDDYATQVVSLVFSEGITSFEDLSGWKYSSLVSVELPSTITSIPSNGFYGCKKLSTVNIPEKVTSIGDSAFDGCSSLTNITIPNSVASIGSSAFDGCRSLTSITLPESVTSIGDSAFCGCSSLTSITIPNSVTSIGERAFSGCSGLTSITIPEGVTSIGESAFNGCRLLKNIILPANLESIGDKAFYECGALNDITISDSVESIGDEAFYGCDSLTEIAISCEVGKSVFAQCVNLGKVTIAEGVTTIKNATFSGCGRLITVDLPNSLKTIGENAFSRCGSLKSIDLSPKLETIEKNAFYACVSLESVEFPSGLKSIGDYAFGRCENLKNITLPDSLETLGLCAFVSCEGIEQITIPKNVSDMKNAFALCDNLKEINVVSDNQNYITDDEGVVYRTDSDGKLLEVICCPAGKEGAYTIPDGVQKIGVLAFGGCNSLIDIKIPGTVSEIEKSAFEYCGNLKYIAIPEGVTEIKPATFYGILNLDVAIPKSVTKIGEEIFGFYGGHPGNIFYAGSEEDWMKVVIGEYNNIYSDNIHYNATDHSYGELIPAQLEVHTPTELKAGIDAYYYCDVCETYFTEDKEETTLEDLTGSTPWHYYTGEWKKDASGHWRECECGAKGTVSEHRSNGPATETRAETCYNCGWEISPALSDANVTWEVDENGVLTISGTGAVLENDDIDKTKITSIIISEGITSIGGSVFWGYEALKSVTLSEGLTSIGHGAFEFCGSLTEITIPKTVTEIGVNPFARTPNLTKIKVEDGNNAYYSDEIGALMSLDGELIAFPAGSTVTAYTVPDGITSIGANAFLNCNSLSSVTLPEGLTSIEGSAFSGCESLSSITLPESLTSIESGAFAGCVSLGSIVLPDELAEIGYEAFSNCVSLAEITIPKTVTEIGGNPFVGAKNLSKIKVEEGNSAYYSDEIGVLMSSDGELIAFPAGSTVTEYTVPDGITSIGDSAFYSCESLNNIRLPEGLTNIEYSAFANCVALNNISLPEGVTTIRHSTFSGCELLTGITLPKTLISIESRAFAGCVSLGSIALPEGLEKIGRSAFSNCYSLTEITIPKTVTEIEENPFDTARNLSKIKVEDGNTAYYSDAVGALMSLDGVLIAFPAGSTVTEYTVPDSITSIEYRAFYGCKSLSSITLPNSLENIDSSSFANCKELKTITFKGSAPNIINNAFYRVTATAYYNGDATWTSDMLQNYGGNITWAVSTSSGGNTGGNSGSSGGVIGGGSSGGGGGGAAISTKPVEITTSDDSVKVSTEQVDVEVWGAAALALSEDENAKVIISTSSSTSISATDENGNEVTSFDKPIKITVPIGADVLKSAEDKSKLTLALVTTDENGNTTLEYVGGIYDSKEDTFTAYTDKPGDYVLVEKQDIVKMDLFIGNLDSTINGATVANDVAPYIANDRTMVPVAFIMNHLGCQVDWIDAERKVVITLPDGEQLSMIIDREIPGFGAVPVIVNDRTMVPIAYIAYAMDCHILWIEDEQRVIIVK